MGTNSKPHDSATGVNRRRVIQVLSTGAALSLAGCGSDEGDGGGDGDGGGNGNGNGGSSDDLGERVPEVQLDYFSNWGGRTAVLEKMMPVVADNIEELGISTSVTPKEISRILEEWLSDAREAHFTGGFFFPGQDRIDPRQDIRRNAVDWAGNNGKGNIWNFANCEYSGPAINQQFAPTEEQRQELITEAFRLTSETAPLVPISSFSIMAATNTNEVDINGVGNAGMTFLNPNWLIKSSPKNRDVIREVISPNMIRTTNYPTSESAGVLAIWNQYVHSPLFQYDENYELQPNLARDYEFSDEAQRLEIELREGGTFHNGDPITTEHVKFTFEILRENGDAYPRAGSMGLSDEGIEIIDDRSMVFHFERPSLSVRRRTLPTWGIMHKPTWENAGVRDDPEAVTLDPIVGSGPFAVTNLEQGQFLETEAHDGHPKYDIDHGVLFRAYGSEQTYIQAFEQGEVDSTDNMSPSAFDRLQGQEGVDARATKAFTPWTLQGQCQWGAAQYPEFRRAVGAVLNRQQIIDVALFGQGDPLLYATAHNTSSPWMENTEPLTKMTDDPTGSLEEAERLLEEAGWGWDDNGNLHYPPDADPSGGLWPQGETPRAEDFPCLNEDGEYVDPNEN